MQQQIWSKGESGRGWRESKVALWGDHPRWKVLLLFCHHCCCHIHIKSSSSLSLSWLKTLLSIITVLSLHYHPHFHYLKLHILRDIKRNHQSENTKIMFYRHSLTMAYTNTTVIATTSFPVTWPLMAVCMIMLVASCFISRNMAFNRTTGRSVNL